MPCVQLTIRQHEAFMLANPGAKPFPDPSVCTCACDIPTTLTVSGFTGDFSVYNSVYTLTGSGASSYDGKVRGNWISEKLGEYFGDAVYAVISWSQPFTSGDGFSEPAYWSIGGCCDPAFGVGGFGQYMCPGMSRPGNFIGYQIYSESCVPTSGEAVRFFGSDCEVLPPNQNSYNVTISPS